MGWVAFLAPATAAAFFSPFSPANAPPDGTNGIRQATTKLDPETRDLRTSPEEIGVRFMGFK
jgi:hypothetical protein